MADLFHMREEYTQGKLHIEELEQNPVDQFQKWFEQICMSGMPDPTAMILATCGADGRPSARMMLLKEYSPKGFTFFTNYESLKGRQIADNPYGALLFAWYFLQRQVRIEGKIEKAPVEKSDRYFENRPAGSRIGSWTSPQSQVIPSREYLEEREKKFTARFSTDSIPRPPEWGGYVLIPEIFEFWQGRENRLHDRFRYRRDSGNWLIERLAP